MSVVVSAPSCQCAMQPFENGVGTTLIAGIGLSAVTGTLPIATPTSNAYTSSAGMRACSAGTCATTGTFSEVKLSNGSALPSWITWPSSSNNNEISVLPTDYNVMASNADWVISVKWTPTQGKNAPVYTAITITVTC